MMAGNYGKFIDRSPILCAAGKPTGDPQGPTVSSTLKEYSLEDKIVALKHNAKIWKENVFVPPLEPPPIRHPEFKGVQTESKYLLNPPVQTRYQTLLQDLRETTYASYWNKEIGKMRDPVPGLPAGTNPKEVTFGKPSLKEITLKELLNPSKTSEQVIQESEIGHDLYKRTHNDFHPSEQIERRYNNHFDSAKTFGIKSKYDSRGIGMKCCLDWFVKEPTVTCNKLQADYVQRVKPQLGKMLTPNNNIKCVPDNYTFGTPSVRVCYGVEDLMKDPDVKPCFFKRDLYKWISSLNKLRILIRKRPTFSTDMDTFYKRALKLDRDKQGFIPMKTFYELCSCFQINFEQENIEALLKLMGIIVDDKINYAYFIDIINSNGSPISLEPYHDIPKESVNYITTNQAAECDRFIINNSDMPPAGIPSVRTDLPRPTVPSGGCRAYLDHLGDDSSVKSLINRSIFTSYGLTYRDFFMPRSSKTLKTLFTKIGYNFPGDTFEQMWKEGVENDKTGLVCIDTFNNLVKKYFPPPKVAVDELECTKMPL